MLVMLRKNGLTSLFKEVRVFKENGRSGLNLRARTFKQKKHLARKLQYARQVRERKGSGAFDNQVFGVLGNPHMWRLATTALWRVPTGAPFPQRKIKGQHLKGKIVSEFSHFFTHLSPRTFPFETKGFSSMRTKEKKS